MKTLPTSSLLAGRIAMAGAALAMFVTFATPAWAQESISDAEAARFLAQATFGPTLEDIAHLKAIGYTAWINEQFALPPSYELEYLDSLGPATVSNRSWTVHQEAWWQNALGGPDPFDAARIHKDQLRQRVAFALSEIFVVSDRSDRISGAPYGVASYYDALVRAAFGNFRNLLTDVTLHPVMGLYLSMLGNQKPDAVRNIRPDENFAREVLQLFTIGLVQLNPDGTPKRDAMGKTIPTYTQDTVKGFAHVFTGWTFEGCKALGYFTGCYMWEPTHPAWRAEMEMNRDYHSWEGSKQLLNYPGVALPGGVLPAGTRSTPRRDLNLTLDNIFNHPNVGPFIARQLIQRLVTSNPSPAYVGRVAAKFNNSGSGMRGGMKAVVRQILLDPEARQLSRQPAGFGKVREPLLRLSHLWRATNARSRTGRTTEWYADYYLGQTALHAPSVFNFFSPAYQPIGEASDQGLVAPELQLATDFMLPTTHNALGDQVFWYYVGNTQTSADSISVDLNRDMPLAATPTALIDRYNVLFLSGQMSTTMRQALLTRLNGMPNARAGRDRVQEALYLIVNSPEYTVQK